MLGAYIGGVFGAKYLLQGPLLEKDVVVTEDILKTGLAFVVPQVCYLYVLWFAFIARKAQTHEIEEGVAVGH